MSFTDGILQIPTVGGETVEARLTDEGWLCDEPETLARLNQLFPYPDNDLLDYRPNNPCVPCDLMRQVVKGFGASIIQIPENNDPPGTIY